MQTGGRWRSNKIGEGSEGDEVLRLVGMGDRRPPA